MVEKLTKIIIAGSRDWHDYELLASQADHFLSRLDGKIQIVSGTAAGADRLGERYAKERGYSVKPFPADWQRHGRAAGMIRNREMAKYADYLIAFWDGKSRGTKGMIDIAEEYGLKYRVVTND